MSENNSENKNEKPIYFTIDSAKYAQLKILCAKYGYSIKDFMTFIIDKSIELEKDLSKVVEKF